MEAIVEGVEGIVILDTNIMIDFLQGREQARLLFQGYREKATLMMISMITVVEVLVGIFDLEKQKKVRVWLQSFQTVSVDSDIAHAAIGLRQTFKLKVPDALIMATAQYHQGILVTRDRDFCRIPGVHYPYTLV
jgi:predicted nucleic acid-binding protein